MEQGRAKFTYNFLGVETAEVEADTQLTTGDHQVRMEFDYDGGGLAKGGDVSLFYDGDKVGDGRVERTIPFIFSADETADVGEDTGTPVASNYTTRNGAFNGDIHWIRVDTGDGDPDHFIDPEERIRVAMARQ
jgi:arylsulfatase